jgi:coenzyme Q-binding protein COQ10
LKHTVTRIMPYAPEQLWALVGDIEHYPDFVPWLTSMRIWNPRSEGEGVTLVDAEASVGFSFLREKFATRVRRDETARTVSVGLLYGPFRRLANNWRFSQHPLGSLVEFDIDFEFKSRLLDALLAANFHRAVDKLIGCFDARARALYGPPGAAATPA